MILILILAAIIYTDYRAFRIPNVLIVSGFVIQSFTIWLNSLIVFDNILGMAVGLLLGLFIAFAGKSWYKRDVFGMGDVKLMALIGFVCGWYYFFPVFFIGTLMATVFSLIGMALKKFSRESKIPLGAFLSLALIFYILTENYWIIK